MIAFALPSRDDHGKMIDMPVRRTVAREEIYPLGALRLYREELEAIANAVAESSELLIESDDLEATSAGDFAQLPERPEKLVIRGTRIDPDRRVVVTLTPGSASVELAEPDTLSAGILARIQAICAPCRRLRLRQVIDRSDGLRALVGVLGPFGIAFGVTGILVAESSRHKTSILWIGNPLLIAVSFAVGIVGVSYLLFPRPPLVIIINAPRAERPTYWQRTRDMWWVGIVTSLAGVIVGYLLGKFT